MITLYYINCGYQLTDRVFYEYLNILPLEIKSKILRFRHWQDAQASLLGKLLLKKGLEDLGQPTDLLNLKYTTYGRPYIENDLHFNISHSGPYIVCAFAANAMVGVDIEHIAPVDINDFKNLFHEKEWRDIISSPDLYRSFFFYWTAKESIIKADGRGLNIPLEHMLVQNGSCCLDNIIWYHRLVPLFDDCMLQIASDKKIEEVNLVELKIQSVDH